MTMSRACFEELNERLEEWVETAKSGDIFEHGDIILQYVIINSEDHAHKKITFKVIKGELPKYEELA